MALVKKDIRINIPARPPDGMQPRIILRTLRTDGSYKTDYDIWAADSANVGQVVIQYEVEEETDPEPIPPPEDIFLPSVWPTDYAGINQPFGANPDYYGQFGLPGHEGIDIEAPDGSYIYSVASGEVYEVVPVADGHNYGIRVRIRHNEGYRSIYAHLKETLVSEGETVTAGDVIGLANSTGNSTGSHLHLTLKHDDADPGEPMYIGYPYQIIDPTSYLMPLQPGAPP